MQSEDVSMDFLGGSNGWQKMNDIKNCHILIRIASEHTDMMQVGSITGPE